MNRRRILRRAIVLLAVAAACGPHAPVAAPRPQPAAEHVYKLDEVDQPPVLQNGDEVAELARREDPAAGEQGMAHADGIVMFEYQIDARGNVDPATIRTISVSDPIFEAPGRRVVARMRFSPARLHGQAVRVLVFSPVSFSR